MITCQVLLRGQVRHGGGAGRLAIGFNSVKVIGDLGLFKGMLA